MSKVGVLVDSNCGLNQAQADEYGLHILPMPLYVDGAMYYEGATLSFEEFFKKQVGGSEIHTSTALTGDLMDAWDELLKEYDEIVFIPISSGLSGACQQAALLAEDYNGRVHVVNNQRVSATQMTSALEAKTMADRGMSAAQIKGVLEDNKYNSTIYLMVDTLEYLKKGGRVTPAAAAIGSLLKIKPVLQILGEKLDAFAKARSVKQAKQIMLDSIASDMEKMWGDTTGENTIITMVHANNPEGIELFKEEAQKRWPNNELRICPLSMVICCHTGPGVIAITCSKKIV